MSHAMDAVSHALGASKDKPKKEIKEIRTRKAKSGGFVHEHHHTAPEHHPMEEHVSPDKDAMAAHMMQNMGNATPDPEAGADPSAAAAAPAAAGAGAPPAGAPPGM